MVNSPFNRSSRTVRSPPPTPSPAPAPPPCPTASSQGDAPVEVISTPEIQNWMGSIEQYLGKVCTIAVEGKLNSEQKLRINTLCCKVGHGTSQMAVQYQSLKVGVVQAQTINQMQCDHIDLSEQLGDLKRSIQESSKPPAESTFADMVKCGSVAINPNDKLKTSDDTKSLVQKIICPEQMKLHVRGLRKTRNGGVIISTETENDIEKLKKSVQLTNSGLTIDETRKRKPRVVVVGVPSSLQEN